MRMGDYTVAISGPGGVVFEALVGLSGRKFARLAIDDEALQELLVVTSVCAGAIDAELITQKRLSQGVPGAAGGPGDATVCVDESQVQTKPPAGIFRREYPSGGVHESWGFALWEHLSREHNLILTGSELREIVRLAHQVPLDLTDGGDRNDEGGPAA